MFDRLFSLLLKLVGSPEAEFMYSISIGTLIGYKNNSKAPFDKMFNQGKYRKNLSELLKSI